MKGRGKRERMKKGVQVENDENGEKETKNEKDDKDEKNVRY
jgi:hypothetical protein